MRGFRIARQRRSVFGLCCVIIINGFVSPLLAADPDPSRDPSRDAATYTPGDRPSGDFQSFARNFLENHCTDCHGGTYPEGNLTLEKLGPVDEINAATWRSIWAQVALKEMPPLDASSLDVVERLKFTDGIVHELSDAMREKGGFDAHRDPEKGNFLNHDLLFEELPDSITLRPTASPARLWRLTPQEHLTRLNELINSEPEFDPKRPGRRTRGDAVPTNHGGELKMYFGVDRIIKWQGGTVAYATAVKSIPAILSTARNHGLENYPAYYTVNSAEATQIMSAAADILRYMADGPLSIANPEQITDDPRTYEMKGDIRGLPTSLVYSTQEVRPITPIRELMRGDGVDDEVLEASVRYLFEAVTFRPTSEAEIAEYIALTHDSVATLGKADGVVLGLSAIFLDRDALFRPELVETGSPDEHGRVMLQDWELGLAVNHALSYIAPDPQLRQSIVDGRMRTREDVRREVTRMLADESFRKPRVLQFFRDYFDYDLGGYVCKDTKALSATGVNAQGMTHYKAMFDATASTDRLVEWILQKDQNVLQELLTTQTVVAGPNDNIYFGRRSTAEERRASVAATKAASKEAEKQEAAVVAALEQSIAELENQSKESPDDKDIRKKLSQAKQRLETKERQHAAARRSRARTNHDVMEASLDGPEIHARVSHRSFGTGSLKPERVLATAPEGQRMGILTHPSWLVSHSDAMDNHAIRRGRWIRERLLGGGVPDVPITVDAMLPDKPKHTLRERMRVTREEYCWTCHQKMDPLGLPFEMYNHAGVYRTLELNEPVDTSGEIIDSGDADLDGEVASAIEMIQRIASSERAEQVFVRHAFRFWMGRNETIHDRPVLEDAHRAYQESGGSMNALITSLLTSDAFLYRTREL